MNKAIYAILLGATIATPAFSQVGVSISVGQPGFYGQIDIGNTPRPPVVYSQPVVIAQSPQYAAAEPIYLHVPPGHEKHWRQHCAEYHACGRPVYFVKDDWYNNEYVPHHRHDHDRDHDDHGHDHHNDYDRDHDHDHGHDHDHDHDR